MQNESVLRKNKEELVLVVPRKFFDDECNFYGIKKVEQSCIFDLIKEKSIFLEREKAEVDSDYKQIIPYLIYKFEEKYFLMQRSSGSSDTRLASKFSLGIGGHIRSEDMNDSQTVLDWAKREFEEEVDFKGEYKPKFLGLLNDETNFVGQVHLGLVFVLEGDSEQISVKEELKSGSLVTLQEIETKKENLESWSKIVFDHFIRN